MLSSDKDITNFFKIGRNLNLNEVYYLAQVGQQPVLVKACLGVIEPMNVPLQFQDLLKRWSPNITLVENIQMNSTNFEKKVAINKSIVQTYFGEKDQEFLNINVIQPIDAPSSFRFIDFVTKVKVNQLIIPTAKIQLDYTKAKDRYRLLMNESQQNPIIYIDDMMDDYNLNADFLQGQTDDFLNYVAHDLFKVDLLITERVLDTEEISSLTTTFLMDSGLNPSLSMKDVLLTNDYFEEPGNRDGYLYDLYAILFQFTYFLYVLEKLDIVHKNLWPDRWGLFIEKYFRPFKLITTVVDEDNQRTKTFEIITHHRMRVSHWVDATSEKEQFVKFYDLSVFVNNLEDLCYKEGLDIKKSETCKKDPNFLKIFYKKDMDYDQYLNEKRTGKIQQGNLYRELIDVLLESPEFDVFLKK